MKQLLSSEIQENEELVNAEKIVELKLCMETNQTKKHEDLTYIFTHFSYYVWKAKMKDTNPTEVMKKVRVQWDRLVNIRKGKKKGKK